MAEPKTKPARKTARRPKRFQVDPLAALPAPEADLTPLSGAPAFGLADQLEIPLEQRIEVLSLEDVQPDPWNPRHILPEDIRQRYISAKISARKAVSLWNEAGEQRPEIAEQIQQYRLMGASLLNQGQINPITVAKFFRQDGTFVWRIESGERRYWSKWLAVFDGRTDEETIHAVLRDELNPTRQAVENLQSEALTAVGEARQVARLFLDRLKITPESDIAHGIAPGSDAFFRIALRPGSELLAGRKRLPRGFWPALEEIMGNKRQHLERKLQVLRLPDELLKNADAHQLSERQLREILSRPEQSWGPIVRAAIEHDLSGPELTQIVHGDKLDASVRAILERRSAEVVHQGEARPVGETHKPKKGKPPASDFPKWMASFVKNFRRMDENELDQAADAIIQAGDHLEMVAKLERLIERLKSRLKERSDE